MEIGLCMSIRTKRNACLCEPINICVCRSFAHYDITVLHFTPNTFIVESIHYRSIPRGNLINTHNLDMPDVVNYNDDNNANYYHPPARANAGRNRNGMNHAEVVHTSPDKKDKIGQDLIKILKDSDTRKLISLLDGAPFVGCGTYNVFYKTMMPGVVMRTSLYDPRSLGSLATFLINEQLKGKKHFPHQPAVFKDKYNVHVDNAAITQGQRFLEMDPVRIKNNMSRFTNMLIKERICPHFVYMYSETDMPAFGKNIGMLGYNKDYRRYTNVSFHDMFTCSLHDAITTGRIDEFQLRTVLFQVLHGLMTLQHYLPGFRHNDLSLKNVLVSISEPKPGQASCYTIYDPSGKVQHVIMNDMGVHAAIADFDLCHAPVRFAHFANPGKWGIQIDASLENKTIENNGFHNSNARELLRNVFVPSFDVFQLLKNLFHCLGDMRVEKKPQFAKYGNVLSWLESMQLFNRPEFARARYTHVDIPFLRPINLINNAFIRPKGATQHSNCSNTWAFKELRYALYYTGHEADRQVYLNTIKGMNESRIKNMQIGNKLVLPNNPYYGFDPETVNPFTQAKGFFIEFFSTKKSLI